MPGPASSVEDRSLCKISSDGTAVRSLPKAIFSDAIFCNMFDGDPTIGRVLPSTQPRSGKAVATISTGRKGKRSLNKSAYDELASLLYYATLQHDSSNLSNNQLSQINLRRIVEALIGRRPSDNGRPTQTRAGRRTIGEQDRAWDTPWNRGCPV